MKQPALVLFLLCACLAANAQTIISGGSIVENTSWDLAGSPYLITGTVTVQNGKTLTIQPGVVVKSQVYPLFPTIAVKGTLHAQDAVFTSHRDDEYGGDSNNDGNASTPGAGDWSGVAVEASSGGSSSFDNCLFRYGGYDRGVVSAYGSSPSMSDCTVFKCQRGLDVTDGGNPALSGNVFDGCTQTPIAVDIASPVDYSDNTFSNSNSLLAIGLINNNSLAPGSYSLAKTNVGAISNIPYAPLQTITVPAGATLSFEPGVIVKSVVYQISATFVVNGALLAQGSPSEPIVFTSPKDDTYGGDTNNDGSASSPNPADWSNIVVNAASGSSSVFQHCIFRFGTYYEGIITAKGSSPVIQDCHFFKCERGVYALDGGSPLIAGNTFEACTTVPVARDLTSPVSFENNSFIDNGMNAIGLVNNSSSPPGASYFIEQANLGATLNAPYAPLQGIAIPAGVSLALAPGVIVKSLVYQIGPTFIVNGALDAQGTEAEPVVFTSYRDDSYGGDTNNDGASSSPAPGDWSNILIPAGSGNSSVFRNCAFRFGTYYDGAITALGSSPVIEDCVFFRCTRGVYALKGGSPVIAGNTFEACETVPVARDLETAVSFENNAFIDNGMNAVGLVNSASYLAGSNYFLEKTNLGAIENAPYAPLQTLTIPAGVTLTIQPGVIVKSIVYQISATFVINGTLIAQGTPADPIVFTSAKDDAYGGDTNNDGATAPNTGDWSNIVIEAASGSSSLVEHCIFRYGAVYDAALTAKGSTPVIAHNAFFRCEAGVSLQNSGAQVLSCSFSENVRGCVVNNANGEVSSIDSSLFCKNIQAGLRIASGEAQVSHSSFWENTGYDIENQSASAITAGANWWAHEVYSAILANPDTNLPKIYDAKDNPAKGAVSVAGPQAPLTDFSYDVAGFRAFFNNKTTQDHDFYWDFGDNTQSGQVNPSHDYGSPGYYTVCLEPAGCDEDIRGSLCQTVLVKGLKSLYPRVSGNDNTYIGLISGAGFTPNDIVRLSKAGQSDIVADTVIYIDSTLIKAFFRFEGAPLGQWDLEVQGANLDDVLPNALSLEESLPISLSPFVEGRNRLRTNRPVKMKVGVRNNSNQTVYGVPVYLSVGNGVEIKILNEILADTIPAEIAPFMKNNLMKVADPDSPGDTSLVGVYLIPYIHPYEAGYIEVELLSTTPLNDTLTFSTGLPWFTAEDLIEGGVLYRSFPELSPCVGCALTAAGLLPGPIGCIADFFGLIYDAYNTLGDYLDGNTGSATLGAISVGIGILNVATCWSGLSLGDVFGDVGNQMNKAATGLGIPDCLACAKDQLPPFEFPFQSGNSFDPNDKIAQAGVTEAHYIGGQEKRLAYTVFFENLETATAPASEVFITDLLDTARLDIHTLRFTGFGFGERSVNFPLPLADPTFTADIDLSPEKDIIVRVQGQVSAESGLVQWSFRSFDPQTMDLTEDFDLGFLPPNASSPEGEGYVSFTIDLKEGLPHLTEIQNEATIVFDNNPPIATPVWSNTIDSEAPQSAVTEFPGISPDTTFTVQWSGEDMEAGLGWYYVYYSVNGGPWELWQSLPAQVQEAAFTGNDGDVYCFYTVARDLVGNVEETPAGADACTQIVLDAREQGVAGYNLMQNRPNPFSQETVIGFVLPEATEATLYVTDQLGRRQVLAGGRMSAGYHQVVFRPEPGTAGVVYFTLVTPRYMQTVWGVRG
jgi:hypothetical protein